MWISNPITTVPTEHIPVKMPATAKMKASSLKWFTESSMAGAVIHGNHPFSVRRHSRDHAHKTKLYSQDQPLKSLSMEVFINVISDFFTSLINMMGRRINRTLLRRQANRLRPNSSDQSKLYELALQDAQTLVREHEQVIFIQHSGYMVTNQIISLLKQGVDVVLYQQEPSIKLLANLESIRTRIKLFPQQISVNYGNAHYRGRLTVKRFTSPASLRVLYIKEKLLILSWYNYLYIGRELKIVGSENPGLLLRNSDSGFTDYSVMVNELLSSYDKESTHDAEVIASNIFLHHPNMTFEQSP